MRNFFFLNQWHRGDWSCRNYDCSPGSNFWCIKQSPQTSDYHCLSLHDPIYIIAHWLKGFHLWAHRLYKFKVHLWQRSSGEAHWMKGDLFFHAKCSCWTESSSFASHLTGGILCLYVYCFCTLCICLFFKCAHFFSTSKIIKGYKRSFVRSPYA